MTASRPRRSRSSARPGAAAAALGTLLLLGLALLLGGGGPAGGTGETPEPSPPALAAAGPLPTAPAPVLRFADHVSPHAVIATAVLPAEVLDLEIGGARGARWEARAADGQLTRTGPAGWRWTAPPDPSPVLLGFRPSGDAEPALSLRAFVMRPYAGQEVLDGFRIGRYAGTPPPGLVEVRPGDESLPVSPHFRLGEFLSRQTAGPPQFVRLDTRLLLELERILETVRKAGIPASTLRILSAFRTPHYNAAIGNTTTRSRHTWGDAADVFVDEDGDGRMDDLDGDGRETVADARVLYDLIEEEVDDRGERLFLGGLGLYGPKPHRGPFVHVDVRGRHARW